MIKNNSFMKKPFFLLILLIFLSSLFTALQAQKSDIKRTWHWYFGDQAGLNFSSGSPVVDTNGQLIAYGCHASVSDTAGNLLFYSDGWNVWNKSHQLMPHGTGLLTRFSDSFRNTLAVKQPGNNNIYYIFAWQVDSAGTETEFDYAIVDMNLDGGLGDVTSTQNIIMIGMMGYAMAATKHANDTDVWIIAMKRYTNSMYAFLLTSSGINLTPVISQAGINPPNTMPYNFKFSPDGKKMGATFNLDGYEILDFDKSTGIFSNPIVFPSCDCEPYGVEFSPDGSKVYFAVHYYIIGYTDGGALYQVTLTGDSATTINSKLLLDTLITANDTITGNDDLGLIFGIQLASNGKIYTTHDYESKLGTIANPNVSGLSCNYSDSVIYLQGRNCYAGLPLFMSNYFYTDTLTDLNNYFIEKDAIILYQNDPNPFAEETDITYFLPETVGSATIMFYDNTGVIIKSVQLQSKGNGTLHVYASDLSSGMYTYALIVDGKMIDSKKMMKTK